MSIIHGAIHYLGGYQTQGSLNTSAAATRRKAISYSPSALKIEAENGRVFFQFGDSSVDLTGSTGADVGMVNSATGAELVAIPKGSTHISFYAASDTPTVYMIEVQ